MNEKPLAAAGGQTPAASGTQTRQQIASPNPTITETTTGARTSVRAGVVGKATPTKPKRKPTRRRARRN